MNQVKKSTQGVGGIDYDSVLSCTAVTSYLGAYFLVGRGRTASLAAVCLGNEAGKAAGTGAQIRTSGGCYFFSHPKLQCIFHNYLLKNTLSLADSFTDDPPPPL